MHFMSAVAQRDRFRRLGRARLAASLTVLGCSLGTACCVGVGASGAKTLYNAHSQFRIAPVKAAVAELPSSIRKQGVLVAAMTATAPPGSYFPAGSHTLVGFDPSIAQLLASALGLKLQMMNVSFDSIIPGMAAGRYPVTVSEMAPSTAREKVLDFVDYGRTGDALAVAKGNPKHININRLCGLTVGALAGGYQITVVLPPVNKQCIKDHKPAIKFKLFPNESAPVLALASGRVDAVYEDSTVLDYAAAHNPNVSVQTNRNFGPVAVGVGKKTGLLRPVHTAMQAIIKSPRYHAMLRSLGLGSVAITDAKTNDNG